LDALVEDRVLPIVGAGFSMNADLPAGLTMPLWSDLGEELKDEVQFLSPDADPIEVISAYSAEHGRQALVARLRRALHDGDARPGEAHHAFARLPFDIVVTTNFDSLLEDAYRDVGRSVRSLIREDQLASRVPRSAVSLVKAHGDYDNEPVLVATEEDYDAFLLARPLLATYLANLLITRVALLVGYSLSDTDWRQLLASVRSRLGRSQQVVYAIAVDASPVAVERFRRRGVTVIALPSDGKGRGEVLTQIFLDMRAHIAAHALDRGTIRDEGALEELRVANRDERRLVLFLVPERLLAFYRELVFPVLRAVSIQPITPYEVDAPGTTLYATTTALVEEASAVVADISGGESSVVFEIGLAMTSDPERRSRLAVVAPRGAIPFDVGGARVFRAPLGVDDDLANQLIEWLHEILGDQRDSLRPRTRVADDQAQDPTWRVIRAFRDLEIALRDHYEDDPSPMIRLLQHAIRDGIIDESLGRRLTTHRQLRNAVLHDRVVASVAVADQVVRDVAEAIIALNSAAPL
jgi:hypothetical protein